MWGERGNVGRGGGGDVGREGDRMRCVINGPLDKLAHYAHKRSTLWCFVIMIYT